MEKSQYSPSQHKSMLGTSKKIRKILKARTKYKTVFYNIESTQEDMFDRFRKINDLYAVHGGTKPMK